MLSRFSPSPGNRVADGWGRYKGATVIEPIPGFYDDPVTTLDFASLYPSIMISNNLCYSTILDGAVPLPADQIYTIHTDQGVMRFVKQGVKLGVFVMVLEDLLAARSTAKAGAAANRAGDKLTPKGRMFDIRQNALKMTANSGYGTRGNYTSPDLHTQAWQAPPRACSPAGAYLRQ